MRVSSPSRRCSPDEQVQSPGFAGLLYSLRAGLEGIGQSEYLGLTESCARRMVPFAVAAGTGFLGIRLQTVCSQRISEDGRARKPLKNMVGGAGFEPATSSV